MTDAKNSSNGLISAFGPYLFPLLLLLMALALAWFFLRPASQDVRSQEIARQHWENNLKNADLQLMSNPSSIHRLSAELASMEAEFFEQTGKILMIEDTKSQEVIKYFRSFGTTDQTDIANYALGHAYFLEGNYAKAITFFKKYQEPLEQTSSPFQDVEFFLLLAYIANGTDALVVDPLLQSIVDNKQHRFHNAVRTLQQSIAR
ncbi:MAG: tetratricopeptide repeat protein [Bacteroidota bacterium]